MTKFFLALHVLVAIIAIGPVAVAASMFPAAVRRAGERPGDGQAVAVVRILHRVCRVYAVIGIAVPVFGFATAGRMHATTQPWVLVSIGLTAVAAAVLALLVLPRQGAILAAVDTAPPATPETAALGPIALGQASRVAARLAMHTGVFNLLWAIVTVLMILRPGSTTGA
ncbi:hypothetical protein F0L68_24325 [Solihabitans fulvus]|uniref:Uncharacterized protein n=1 Tax=Solihabitans fulvus TaxID=1892852 RepID=A0A5B2X4M1_9PSEU|nr:hypothetical protein [Solihabitans fulvus]KAA2258105.1 hypothetical protein F0L68_24325 [Solihabitans fulvus]